MRKVSASSRFTDPSPLDELLELMTTNSEDDAPAGKFRSRRWGMPISSGTASASAPLRDRSVVFEISALDGSGTSELVQAVMSYVEQARASDG